MDGLHFGGAFDSTGLDELVAGQDEQHAISA